MSEKLSQETFVPLHTAALRLGIPAAWLKSEALAARVPFLRAGKRFLFNVGAVERELLARTTAQRNKEGTVTHAVQ